MGTVCAVALMPVPSTGGPDAAGAAGDSAAACPASDAIATKVQQKQAFCKTRRGVKLRSVAQASLFSRAYRCCAPKNHTCWKRGKDARLPPPQIRHNP